MSGGDDGDAGDGDIGKTAGGGLGLSELQLVPGDKKFH